MGAGVQSSSKYVIDLGRCDQGFQEAFGKIDATVRLQSRDDQWELALIGNNLNDQLTSGGCYDINYAGGSIFPGIGTASSRHTTTAES
jgi:iron complex outermembrane receptor protein